jgi:hypothetical protein
MTYLGGQGGYFEIQIVPFYLVNLDIFSPDLFKLIFFRRAILYQPDTSLFGIQRSDLDT